MYEVRLNSKKSSIYLLKPDYLQQFLNDFRDIMIYGRSSQFINDNTIKTENTNITMHKKRGSLEPLSCVIQQRVSQNTKVLHHRHPY